MFIAFAKWRVQSSDWCRDV